MDRGPLGPATAFGGAHRLDDVCEPASSCPVAQVDVTAPTDVDDLYSADVVNDRVDDAIVAPAR